VLTSAACTRARAACVNAIVAQLRLSQEKRREAANEKMLARELEVKRVCDALDGRVVAVRVTACASAVDQRARQSATGEIACARVGVRGATAGGAFSCEV
jgi:hypothetical protein